MPSLLHRRRFLASLTACGGALCLPGRGARTAHSAPASGDRRYLITLGMFGGASIIDSFLPIAHGESANAATVNCFPDSMVVQPPGANLRTVDWSGNNFGHNYTSGLPGFLAAHKDDMLVATVTGTSVNHTIGQRRAMTGNGAWQGRTLPEAVAAAYGQDCPLPNVNMSSNGFAQNGDDIALPGWAYAEPVPDPVLWPLSLHGTRALRIDDGAGAPPEGPNDELVGLARALRRDHLDPESSFHRTFQLSPDLARWRQQRDEVMPRLEAASLISKLNLVAGGGVALEDYGLTSSPDLAAVTAAFPRLGHDPLHAQAAMAYLLIKHDIAVSVTLGPNFNVTAGAPGEPPILNPPLSFDHSHTDHRNAQAFMWTRMLDVADALITLLKTEETSPGSGVSKWDRTMIYCATDFGRTKGRTDTADRFGTGHDLNNGVLAISPLLAGNRVLGGVDPDTGMTYGFDPTSGAPDPGREMSMRDIYSGLAEALGIPTGLAPVSAMTG
ncbi:MAG: hypothetical protein AAF928_02450 [Myxococcota bacterium]